MTTPSDSDTTPVPDVVGRPEYPHIRKVGRYLFYAPCAFGLGILVAVAVRMAGASDAFSKEAVLPVFFVAFLALRDIEKNAEKRAAIALTKEPAQ